MEDFEKIENIEPTQETPAVEDTDKAIEDTNAETSVEADLDSTYITAESEAPVKKNGIQKPLIIAACILVIAVIAAGVYFLFFNNSVVGTWIIDDKTSTADEASKTSEENERYYTFNNDGSASIKLGTIEIFGEWNYASDSSSSSDQQGDKIEITILPIIKGTFDYKLDGNQITGRTMTISGTNTSDIVFKSASKADPELKVSKKFKADKTVTGKWKNKDYNLVYSFNADGTCDLNNNDRIATTGTYTVDSKKKQITVVYIGEKKSEMYIPYSEGDKKDTINLSGYEFSKVKE